MKKLFFTLFIAFTANFSFGQTTVFVKGYYRDNGTYVQPYYRTSPNNTVMDNWSTFPNVNPYTGEIGSKHFDNNYIPKNTQNNNVYIPNPITTTNSLFQQNQLFSPR